MRIAIVTPDLIGPIKNGGIGTFATNAARLWRGQGHDVSIIFTGVPEVPTGWQDNYAREGIEVATLAWSLEGSYVRSETQDWFYARSQEVHEMLRGSAFDFINFQDWHAAGLVALQARAAGMDYAGTALTLTVHSPTVWGREGQQRTPKNPAIDVRLDAAEAWCMSAADHVLFPSHYMEGWVRQRGIAVRRSEVLRLPLIATELESESDQRVLDNRLGEENVKIVFFGRLETRKGLEIFCRALTSLPREVKAQLGTVLFLGKSGETTSTTMGDEYAFQAMRRANIPAIILSDVNAVDALKILRSTGATAVMPSLVDNMPYTVLECLALNIPIAASRVGGVQEVLPEKALFDANEESLAIALTNIALGSIVRSSEIDQEKLNDGWSTLPHRLRERSRRVQSPLDVTARRERARTQRLVFETIEWRGAEGQKAAVLVRDARAVLTESDVAVLATGIESEAHARPLTVVAVARERHKDREIWPTCGPLATQVTASTVDQAVLLSSDMLDLALPSLESNDCIAALMARLHSLGARQVVIPVVLAHVEEPHEHSYAELARIAYLYESELPASYQGLIAGVVVPLVATAKSNHLPDGSIWYALDKAVERALPLASRRRQATLTLVKRVKRLIPEGAI